MMATGRAPARHSSHFISAQPVLPKCRRALTSPSWIRYESAATRLPVRCSHAAESEAVGVGGDGRVDGQQPVENLPGLGALVSARRLQPDALSNSQLAEEELDLPVPGGPLDWVNDNSGLRDSCEVSKQHRVAVLLSGGVDSSLALQLLHAAGHKVTAFYLQIWFQEDFRNFWDSCPWEEDLQYAQEVCSAMGVELEVVPLTNEYWDRVVRFIVGEVRRGRTPNPDILCNSRVKFGAFFEHLETKYAGQFDRIASGHYARLLRPSETGQAELAMTPDAVKDQTYFLAQLSQEQLARAMFPLGPLTKQEVRQMACAAGLATQGRKDSQGICFLGKVKFSEFVKEHLGEWPGLILEEETDRILGSHRGFWFHTIGQRSGLLLPDGPWYVVRKDMDMNVVYASKHYYAETKVRRSFECAQLNWINGSPPSSHNGPIECKVRHGPRMYTCALSVDGSRAAVELDSNDQGLAAGQYAVFYQNGVCFGCGVIQEQQHQRKPGGIAVSAGSHEEALPQT